MVDTSCDSDRAGADSIAENMYSPTFAHTFALSITAEADWKPFQQDGRGGLTNPKYIEWRQYGPVEHAQ